MQYKHLKKMLVLREHKELKSVLKKRKKSHELTSRRRNSYGQSRLEETFLIVNE